MSAIEQVPEWAISKSGEAVSGKFLAWVAATKKSLAKSFPKAEQQFCRIVDGLKSRMSPGAAKRLHYTRQKHFIVADKVVFFGDFYFRNLRLLVEIDGASHAGPVAAEKDRWRTSLIEMWKVDVVRIDNDTVLHGDFIDIERWLVQQAGAGRYGWRSLADSYNEAMMRNPHIYAKQTA